ncbi:hypothetical protein B0H67DRAFT_473872 [Lasiosphaeris hirsuta]|uniref:SET domain-containing protein n=1 Tax=Lasiosphaeris hirsuta TaxID=260670 RepID=A0AA40B8C9_9PEZI|nr:hypothetical protein B0H67DRAFT_473872 [Lasiosphaeris hirsuta]
MGVGAFSRPGKHIEKGEIMGAYVGEVQKRSNELTSRSAYVYDLVGTNKGSKAVQVVVDGQTHGNWTRFCNHHCNPNVVVTPEQVGKIVLLVFSAAKRISGGSQIFINYGRDYFTDSNMLCVCSTNRVAHLPPVDSNGDSDVDMDDSPLVGRATKRSRIPR